MLTINTRIEETPVTITCKEEVTVVGEGHCSQCMRPANGTIGLSIYQYVVQRVILDQTGQEIGKEKGLYRKARQTINAQLLAKQPVCRLPDPSPNAVHECFTALRKKQRKNVEAAGGTLTEG